MDSLNNLIIPCEIVVNITLTWPNVTRSDIEHVRDIVMNHYFPSPKIDEEGIEHQIGYAFQEMRYLHRWLNGGMIGDEKKLLEDEMWYLVEWLKRNKKCYTLKSRYLYEVDTRSLSKYYTDKTVWIINERKKREKELGGMANS